MALDWRTIIVGGLGVNNQLLLPKGYKADKFGNQIVNKSTGEAQTEYMTPESASSSITVDWATKQEVLNNTEPQIKDVFNEIKTLLRNVKYAAVVYHGAADPCSLCRYNHYHLIVGRTNHAPWEKDYRWRKIRAACKASNEPTAKVQVTSQKVNNMQGLVRYLARAPRKWYGTNCKDIAVLRSTSLESGTTTNELSVDDTEPAALDTFLGVAIDSEEDNPWGPIDTITVDTATARPPKKAAGWGSVELQGLFTESPSSSSIFPSDADGPYKKGTESITARLIQCIHHIMVVMGTSSKDRLRSRVDAAVAAGDEYAHNYLARLKNADYSLRSSHIYAAAANEYRNDIQKSNLKDLIITAWCQLTISPRSDTIPLNRSIELWFDWVRFHGIRYRSFIADITRVLDRRGGKQNCVFLWGASNSGKSMMFTAPLETLMQDVGRIIQLNTSNAFLFEGCIKRRLISIEECSISPMHVEEMKKILGGETCVVNVKNIKEGGEVMATPVIATSNTTPAIMVPMHESAILNRLHLYEARAAYSALADYAGLSLDPRVYCLLLWIELVETEFNLGDILDEGFVEVLGNKLSRLGRRIDPVGGNLYSLFSAEGDPEYPPGAIDSYFNDRPIVNPFKCTPTQLQKILPGYIHADLHWEDACPLLFEYMVFARFKGFWLGGCINNGHKIPNTHNTDNWCVNCFREHTPRRGWGDGGCELPEFTVGPSPEDRDSSGQPIRQASGSVQGESGAASQAIVPGERRSYVSLDYVNRPGLTDILMDADWVHTTEQSEDAVIIRTGWLSPKDELEYNEWLNNGAPGPNVFVV